MSTAGVLFLSLVVLATVKVSEGQVMTLLYHESVNLTCNATDPDLDLQASVRRVWILPTGETVEAGTVDHPRVNVLEDGYLLEIKNVDDPDFGLYHCLVYVYNNGKILVSRHGINVDGPYYGDLFDLRYRRMLITAAVAAAICFVVVGTICFLYNRQQLRLDTAAEEDKALYWEQHEQAEAQKSMTSHANPAYVPETEGNGTVAPGAMYPSLAYADDDEGAGSKKGRAPPAPRAFKMRDVIGGEDEDDVDGDVMNRTKL